MSGRLNSDQKLSQDDVLIWAGQHRKYLRKYEAQAWKYPRSDPERLHFRDWAIQWQATMLVCPSFLAHCWKPTQDRMLILCMMWQFSDSRRCTWPSILALLWPINGNVSWLSTCAPPHAVFKFWLSTMRKPFHIPENHEITTGHRRRFHSVHTLLLS